MILTDDQLIELYQGVIKPFQHPDPIGFVTRALLLSEGDPDFAEGNVRGFLPLDPAIASEQVGATEVQTLQSNVSAALAIDRLNFEEYRNIDDMVLATHFPEDDINGRDRTSAQRQFLSDIDEQRKGVLEILQPRLATVEDVIKMINNNRQSLNISSERVNFFDYLLSTKI